MAAAAGNAMGSLDAAQTPAPIPMETMVCPTGPSREPPALIPWTSRAISGSARIVAGVLACSGSAVSALH